MKDQIIYAKQCILIIIYYWLFILQYVNIQIIPVWKSCIPQFVIRSKFQSHIACIMLNALLSWGYQIMQLLSPISV